MSATDPLSDSALRALARRARNGGLSKNEAYELNRAKGLAGSLGRELARIERGEE